MLGIRENREVEERMAHVPEEVILTLDSASFQNIHVTKNMTVITT